ncbi:hypothetical protein N7453_001949 [Penicillium expansum]|nr:hypothetical protein N7453_001949 [Penicillium expansum]
MTFDGPNGPPVTTITGITDASGVAVPITIYHQQQLPRFSLASELSISFYVVIRFSSSTANSAKANSAALLVVQ